MARKKSGLQFNRKRKKRINYDLVLDIVAWVIPITIMVVIAGILVNLFAIRSNMIGSAMEDTLKNGDQILINKFCYIVKEPQPGDVVVFLPNGNERSHYYVRRIIAGPQDELVVENGCLYVNREPCTLETVSAYIEEAGILEEPIVLGADEYFVMGDNLSNSEDSRYANIGNVKKKYIIGRAWFYFGSWTDMGFID